MSREIFAMPSASGHLIQVANLLSGLFSSLFLCDDHTPGRRQVQKFLHLTFKFGHFFCTRVSLLTTRKEHNQNKWSPIGSPLLPSTTWLSLGYSRTTHYSRAVGNYVQPNWDKIEEASGFCWVFQHSTQPGHNAFSISMSNSIILSGSRVVILDSPFSSPAQIWKSKIHPSTSTWV